MRVTLIQPPCGHVASKWEESGLPPLGLAYLAAYLEKHDVDCEILDAHALRLTLSDVYDHLKTSRPTVVGVTFTTDNRFIAFDTIRTVKSALPDVLLIAGGPHVSATAEDTLSGIPEVDIVVRGEGEQALLQIVEQVESGGSLEEILSISYRREDRVINNPSGELIPDLDTLPFPARHLLPMDRYQFVADVPGVGKLRALNIMGSRGCPFNCSFCACCRLWQGRYRARSAENMLAEVDELVNKYGAQVLWVFDDTFSADRKRTLAFCEGMAARYPDVKWFCETRVDRVDRELLTLMKSSGCFCIGFGVESGSQRIIDQSVGKGIKLEQVHQVIAWCEELGIQYNPFMILSHPGETQEEARMSMNLVRKWRGNAWRVGMGIMRIYPGTRIEAIARERGIIPKEFSWTSKADSQLVPTLPAAQGDTPLFVDQLSWDFLSSCLFEWAQMQQYSIIKRIPKIVRSIRSFSDVMRYWGMFRACVSVKMRRAKS